MSKVIDTAKETAYMQQSGVNSSFLEGAIFDQLFGKNIGDSISTVSAMKQANDQGIPIYAIDSSNVTTVLPKLQVTEEIKAEVADAVNAGLTVKIPKTNVTKTGWNGVGYIISNPADGTGAYRISGGLNGGDSITESATVYPLPKTPATGMSAFVIGTVISNSGATAIIDGGVLVGLSVTGVLEMALLLILIATLIIAIAKTSSPTNWKILRHYTSAEGLIGILGSFPKYIFASPQNSELGKGAYLTDYFEEPDNGGPVSLSIATILGIPSPLAPNANMTAKYINLKINWDIYGKSFIVAKIRGANQYCFVNKELLIDDITIMVVSISH